MSTRLSRRSIWLRSSIAREQPFEARAVLATVAPQATGLAARQAAAVAGIRERALERAANRLGGVQIAQGARGDDMVDDFVDVLRICQDIEDEQTALARVGAFLRDRLQAASVAFVVREGTLAARPCTRRVRNGRVWAWLSVRSRLACRSAPRESRGRSNAPGRSAMPARSSARSGADGAPARWSPHNTRRRSWGSRPQQPRRASAWPSHGRSPSSTGTIPSRSSWATVRVMVARARGDRTRGGVAISGRHRRRERLGQGTGGAGHSRAQRTARPSLLRPQLRGARR